MNLSGFAEFEAKARAAGVDEVIERHWGPDTVITTHTHAFGADAMVTQGELWLACEGRTQHLMPGDRFELRREVPHDARYGPEGATYWVSRRY